MRKSDISQPKKENYIFQRKKTIDAIRIVKTYKKALLDLKPMFQSYRNQLINLHSKSTDWFPYDRYISFNGLHFFIRTNLKE